VTDRRGGDAGSANTARGSACWRAFVGHAEQCNIRVRRYGGSTCPTARRRRAGRSEPRCGCELGRAGAALSGAGNRRGDYDAVMAVNVKAAYFLAQEVARRMTGPGSIIQVSSQMGHVGGIDRAVYCASKHAVEGMTKAMAIEWGPRGIRVNTICPTFIRTPLTEQPPSPTRRRRLDRGQDQARPGGRGRGHHGGGRLPRLGRLGAGHGDRADGRRRLDGGLMARDGDRRGASAPGSARAR
jgi:NAD(P)-dependent dehydrogenase (short-subunit alcohol dehydrogenase family)